MRRAVAPTCSLASKSRRIARATWNGEDARTVSAYGLEEEWIDVGDRDALRRARGEEA